MPYIIIFFIFLIIFLIKYYFKKITVYEYQKGLKYSKGKFVKILDAGQYWIYTPDTKIDLIDIRPRFTSISGQEILSSDGVTLKISLALQYQIEDPHIAVNRVRNYEEGLYLILQMALREIIGQENIDDLLEKRKISSDKLKELAGSKIEELGLKLLSVDVKDIMFPGELKKMFAGVVKAKKEGQAILEKARGETAALRNLANGARMLEDNPNLLQLRLIQVLGESSGNTLVLNLSSENPTVFPVKGKNESIKTEN